MRCITPKAINRRISICAVRCGCSRIQSKIVREPWSRQYRVHNTPIEGGWLSNIGKVLGCKIWENTRASSVTFLGGELDTWCLNVFRLDEIVYPASTRINISKLKDINQLCRPVISARKRGIQVGWVSSENEKRFNRVKESTYNKCWTAKRT